jgi:antitoxin component YwqK of YwqJK toxin-antitoxin module
MIRQFNLVTISLRLVAWAAMGACLFQVALAQDENRESVKIQPYTGKPIFLDEQQQVASPTIVEREKMQEKFENSDQIRIEREVARFSDNHFEADGAYREFYPNGKVFVEGQFRRGRQHGEWTYYFDNGQINRKAVFNEGQPDGAREIYREDGTLLAKRGYKDGKRDGEWITYDKTGKIPLREEHYANGEEDGVWKVWFPSGKLKQQVSLKNGQRHGMSVEWDEKGEKRAEVNYVDNKLHGTVTRWFPDGRTVTQQYSEGKLESQTSS